MLGVLVPIKPCLCLSDPSQCVFFFVYLTVEKAFCCLHVVLRDSCSVCGCSLGVYVGGGELRIFPGSFSTSLSDQDLLLVILQSGYDNVQIWIPELILLRAC